MFTITDEWLREFSGNGVYGWSYKQLGILHINHPLKKGWKSRLIGTKITEDQRIRFERSGTERRANKLLNFFNGVE